MNIVQVKLEYLIYFQQIISTIMLYGIAYQKYFE